MAIEDKREPAVLVFRSNFLAVSETFIRDHLVSLKRWRPIVVFRNPIGDAGKTIGVEAHNVYVPPGFPARVQRLADRWMAAVGFNPKLDRLVRKHDAKLLHAHFLHDGARMAAFARRRKLPLIVTAHGYDATLYDEGHRASANGRFLLKMRPILQETASIVICVSEFIRGELLSQGWPAEKLRTVPLGVDLSHIRPGLPAAERSGVVYVGRLVEKKGGRYLIRAFARLPEPLRRTRLTIIGDGPLRAELEALAKELDVNVEFKGAQPRDVGLDLMGRSALIALPSIRADNGDAEGLPIVTMEAQARACPIVMFDCGSASDAIADGRSGLLARDRDIDDLAAKLAMILSDKALAERLGSSGPAIVKERFDLDINTARLEALYDEIASAHRIKI